MRQETTAANPLIHILQVLVYYKYIPVQPTLGNLL